MRGLWLNIGGKGILRSASWIGLMLVLVVAAPLRARADFSKTIEVQRGKPALAATTWYYANCDKSLGVGYYTINTAPKYGAVTYAGVSGPLPGCPQGSPSLPAIAAYYQWTSTDPTATDDHFQLYYWINGQVGEILDITVVLENVAPAVHILLDGVDVTGTTQTVVVGQQISLSASFAVPPGQTIASQQWSIPGQLYKSFAAGATGRSIPEVASQELNNSAVVFHWVDPDERLVQFSYTLANGLSASADVTFDILAPTPSAPSLPMVTTSTGTVNIGLSFNDVINNLRFRDWLQFGGTPLNHGIIATAHVQAPEGYSGTLLWIQLAQSGESVSYLGGRSFTCANAGEDFIAQNADYVQDSPGSVLQTNYAELSEEMRAQIYLMWQPDLPHSIPAPLGVLPWYWKGAAKRVPYGERWILQPGSTGGAETFVPSTTYLPQWTSTVRDSMNCN